MDDDERDLARYEPAGAMELARLRELEAAVLDAEDAEDDAESHPPRRS